MNALADAHEAEPLTNILNIDLRKKQLSHTVEGLLLPVEK
jgi:hypothetical protein